MPWESTYTTSSAALSATYTKFQLLLPVMSYLIPDNCFFQGNPAHHFLFSSLLMCSTHLLSKEKPNDIVETVILVFLCFKNSEWQSKIHMGLSINYHDENNQLKKEIFKISCVDIKRENIGIFFLLLLSSVLA